MDTDAELGYEFFIHSFIFSFTKYLLGTYHVLDTVINAGAQT